MRAIRYAAALALLALSVPTFADEMAAPPSDTAASAPAAEAPADAGQSAAPTQDDAEK